MLPFQQNKNKKGFTLIELLVVVAIIGLLASIILASLSTARAKARDTKRLTELKQLQTAMELYRSDNGTYPSAELNFTVSIDGCRGLNIANGYHDWSTAINLGKLIPKYIGSLPIDPINSISQGLCYTYTYLESGFNTSMTCLDGATTIDPDGNSPSGPKYAYVITFQTEVNNLALPLAKNVGAVAGAPRLYCLLGPTV